MTEMLDVLVRVPGVSGAALINQAGECVLSQLIPPFEPILIKQLVGEIRSVFHIMRYIDDSSPQLFVLHLDDIEIVVRQIGELTLIALANGTVNSNMLSVGLNVVTLKVKEYGVQNFELASGSGSAPRPPALSQDRGIPVRSDATRISKSISLSDSGQPPSPDYVGDAAIQVVVRALARQMGPVAKVVLKQEAKRIAFHLGGVTPMNFPSVVEAVSQRIADPTKRDAFLNEVRSALRQL